MFYYDGDEEEDDDDVTVAIIQPQPVRPSSSSSTSLSSPPPTLQPQVIHVASSDLRGHVPSSLLLPATPSLCPSWQMACTRMIGVVIFITFVTILYRFDHLFRSVGHANFQSLTPSSIVHHNNAHGNRTIGLSDVFSPRIVVIPYINEGLNNQIIHLENLVKWAAREHATLCWPRVTLRASGNSRSLERPFNALFDRALFQQCVSEHWNVTMAMSIPDHHVCYWLTDVLPRPIIRTPTGVAEPWNINHSVPWPYINELLPSPASDRNAAQVAYQTTLTSNHRIMRYPILRRNDDLTKYAAAWQNGARVFTTQGAFPLWDIRWHGYGSSPLLEHGCIRGPPPLMALQQRVRDGIIALRDNHTSANDAKSPVQVIGLHLRAESGLPCAPNAEYIVTHFCDRFHVPCTSSILMVATGLPDQDFMPILKPHFLDVVSKNTFLTRDDVIGYEREQLAMVDLFATSGWDYFIGCRSSTQSVAGWALTPKGHRLAYGTLRDWEEDDCYPGNADWIRDHQLSISCHLDVMGKRTRK